MGAEISGITVIYLIAVGLQVFILLFLFAQRQILRYAWVGRKATHLPIGFGGPKDYKARVHRFIETVSNAVVYPNLNEIPIGGPANNYRRQALDLVQSEIKRIGRAHMLPAERRNRSLFWLLGVLKSSGCVANVPASWKELCFLYETARYTGKEFGEKEFEELRRACTVTFKNVTPVAPPPQKKTPWAISLLNRWRKT